MAEGRQPEEHVHHAHRRRWVVTVLAVLVAGMGGLTWWGSREWTKPVTVDDLRRGSTTVPGTPTTVTPVGRPAEGIYDYRGSGSEKLTLPPLAQPEGPTLPGTVTLSGSGCWTLKVNYSINHWQTWRYCRTADGITETGGQSWERWKFGPGALTNLTTTKCTDTIALPTERRPGQTWPARCVSTNSNIKGETLAVGPTRFIGDEDVEVGGTTVRTAHLRRSRKFTGAQRGTEGNDIWIALDTGLPVKLVHRTKVATGTPIGDSVYEESGTFALRSITPV